MRGRDDSGPGDLGRDQPVQVRSHGEPAEVKASQALRDLIELFGSREGNIDEKAVLSPDSAKSAGSSVEPFQTHA